MKKYFHPETGEQISRREYYEIIDSYREFDDWEDFSDFDSFGEEDYLG